MNQTISLRAATPADTPLILALFAEARRLMRERGSNQWSGEYPGVADARADIARETAFFYTLDNIPAAYFCLDYGGDPFYERLEGRWLAPNQPYAVLHRLCVSSAFRGRGLATKIFAAAEEKARADGLISMRVDTSPRNAPMLRVIKKRVFDYRGDIELDDIRVMAFQKMLITGFVPERVDENG